MSALQIATRTVDYRRDDIAEMGGAIALDQMSAARTANASTLAECVPWLQIALDLIERGPTEFTIEAVERYRVSAMEILEYVRPVVEREAQIVH